jgi:hypothetical protein
MVEASIGNKEVDYTVAHCVIVLPSAMDCHPTAVPQSASPSDVTAILVCGSAAQWDVHTTTNHLRMHFSEHIPVLKYWMTLLSSTFVSV